MYVVFYGTDRGGVRDAATNYISKNMSEGGALTTIEAGEFESGQVSDALGAQSLFGGEEWFVLDSPAENADFAEEVKNSLAAMAESTNTFVILEGALLAPAKKTYAKHASEMNEFAATKEERFNTFAMAEALATKNKRQLWTLLQETKMAGLRDEEIIGMLWWQLKALRLAALTSSATEAGMKDFPYNKAKRALVNFPNNSVVELAESLLVLYHDGHGGVREMDLSLEQWVLEM